MNTRTFLHPGVLLAAVVQVQAQLLVREDQPVRVNSVVEHWLLVWRGPPQSLCGPEDPQWSTCPCQGFAFGEMGKLDLVRRRSDRSDETLPLAPLFSYGEVPSAQYDGGAALQRWPVLTSDDYDDHSVAFANQVRQRPSVKAIQVGDYDHDGQATEFPIQIANGPCGHNGVIVVGLSRRQPRLHAFTSIAHPERPLILETHIWDELLHSHGQIATTRLACGDHGSEEEVEVRLVASPRGIDATRLTYHCTPDDKRSVLKSMEAI